HDFNIRLIFRYRSVADCSDAIPHTFDHGIVRSRIGVFLQPRLTAHQTNGSAVVDRILAVETLPDVTFVTQIEDQRCNPNTYEPNRFRRRMVSAMKIDAAVDRWMHDDSAGVGFIRVISNLEIFTQTGSNLRQVVF